MHRWFLILLLCVLLTTTAAGQTASGMETPGKAAAEQTQKQEEPFPLVESLSFSCWPALSASR